MSFFGTYLAIKADRLTRSSIDYETPRTRLDEVVQTVVFLFSAVVVAYIVFFT